MPLIFSVVILAVEGCSSISPFDQYAYRQTTSLKVETLALMENAVDSAGHYEADIDRLTMNIDKMYEYEKGRPKNEISAQMWEILKNPDKHLLGGFIKKWRSDHVLHQAYIDDKREQIGKAFDIISGLESSKVKPDEATALFPQ